MYIALCCFQASKNKFGSPKKNFVLNYHHSKKIDYFIDQSNCTNYN